MRNEILLSGLWQKEESGSVFSDFSVPFEAPVEKMPETLILRRKITVSQEEKNSVFFLEIMGLSGRIRAFVDGATVGGQNCSEAPRYFEITEFIKKGESQEIKLEIMPAGNPYGDFTLFDIRVICVSLSHFDVSLNNDPLTLRTVFFKDGVKLSVSADIINPNNYDVVVFRLLSPNGQLIDVKTARPTDSTAEFEIPDPLRWDGIHSSYKHTIQAVLQRDSDVIDAASKNFGISEFVESKEGFFKLNGISLPLSGSALRSTKNIDRDAESLKELDANLVLIDHIDPEEKILNKCDELGIMVFYRFPCTGDDSDFDELQRVTRLLSSHPCAAFISYNVSDPAYGKKFCSTVKSNSRFIYTAGESDLLSSESLSDAVPDVLLLQAGVSAEKNGFTELENRYNEIISTHPDYRFAVFPAAPECITDRHSSGALRPDCSQEYFSMWHEKVWNIFGTKKNTVCCFTGYLSDKAESSERTGLISAGGEKKDAFWFYKAQFSAVGFVKIASLPDAVTKKYITFKCCTNLSAPVLILNGKLKKKIKPVKLSSCLYRFDSVKLKRKENVIELKCGENTDKTTVFRSRSRLKKV